MFRKQNSSKKKLHPVQQAFSNDFKIEKEFGGAHLKKSHAKKARPIAIKKTMHLTLRSSKAKGKYSLRLNKDRINRIEKVVRSQAQKFGVEIFRYANVGNHLHLLIKPNYRLGFIYFLRAISGIISRIALGAERGQSKLKAKIALGAKSGTAKLIEKNQFWDQRPWTRILFTWTEFKNVKKYVEQNFNEAAGFIIYKPRKYRSTA